MRFLVDAMLPPSLVVVLQELGHDAVTPGQLGAHNLPDDVLIDIAAAEDRVIVTESASDFAQTTTCAVLLVRKAWWPRKALPSRVGEALDRWASRHPEPAHWVYWLPPELR